MDEMSKMNDKLNELIKEHIKTMEKRMRESDDPMDRAFMHMQDTADTLKKKMMSIQLYASMTKDTVLFETIAALFEDVSGRIDSLEELIRLPKMENLE